ncbi:aspartic peptidase domain-containing protein [Sordaria brevicollis]|uniref:Aspartic peptidase domain-containing protein n=1 Tax=Sordaria brevicollis TaxID=83679 RepID=A0AAE0PLZ0_SORBR|nr:aspartic peptidase domain-containing protein [Sordaria brevicollis]
MLPLTTLSLALLSPAAVGVLAQQPKPPIKVAVSPHSHQRSPSSLATRGNGFIRAPIHAAQGAPKMLRRRQEDEGLNNENLGTTYTIDIEIGTPGQTVTLILDTGSPDLWVNPQCETSGQEKYCSSFPQFDYTKSKTIRDLEQADILSYGKGNVTIEYVTDDVVIGSAKVKSQILGIGFESHDIPLGILGLSPSVNPNNQPYPYLLDSMVDQGIISSRAFSLDLRSIDNPSGAIIFGGIDLAKFSGPLAKLPMLDPSQTPSGADRYWIVLSGVGMTYPDGEVAESDEIAIPVFLDSGGTLSRLPSTIFQAIGDSFPGSQYDPKSGFYIVDCSIASEPGSVDFIFGSNKKIRVPYGDFIWQVQSDVCVVGVLPTDDEPVFGDSFLRAAYVVYDQDNRNLHLAQAANCGEEIVEIGSGVNAVGSSLTGKCKEEAGGSGGGGGEGGLDVTTTRKPTRTASGGGPQVTNSEFGPGPAGTRVSTGGLGLPTPTGSGGGGGGGNGGNDDDDSRASGLDVGVTVAVALAGLNMLVVWLL